MGPARHLSLDLETYSGEDLAAAGLYRYVQSPDFEILLLAWSVDGGPVEVADLASGEAIPPALRDLLFDLDTAKHAYNAAFEWYCLARHFGLSQAEAERWLPQWRCTMLHGLYCGYPAGLAAVGRALGLAEEERKLAAGRALIAYFCRPCKPTRANGGRRRNLPHHDPDRWALFRAYNARDVATEREIERRLAAFPVPEEVQAQWVTDQIINARGVAVDLALVEGARSLDQAARTAALEEACAVTGLQNPNSGRQLLPWLRTRLPERPPEDIRKETVRRLLDGPLPADARRALELRQALGKTSCAKYDALAASVCADGRVRGLLQFYGASRTGRWAGRLVQVQNLPRTSLAPALLPLARALVRARQGGTLAWVFGPVPDTLSQLVRAAFVAAPGHTLVDADFSAIEARVLAWLAGEEWVLEVFGTHGKIYEATAAQMFGVSLERIRKGNPEYSYRQKGKVATLALGYQGGPGSLVSMGALEMGIPAGELEDIVSRWRQANPHIVRFWGAVECAAREAVNTGRPVELPGGRLRFARQMDPARGLDFLTVRLPSGRSLFYPGPHMGTNRFGRPCLCYWGLEQKTRQWGELETYGGKLAENITQAVARDCLAEGIERLEAAGFPVIFHIHDEVVVETSRPGAQALEEVRTLLAQPPAWAGGLPLRAEGWFGDCFRKD